VRPPSAGLGALVVGTVLAVTLVACTDAAEAPVRTASGGSATAAPSSPDASPTPASAPLRTVVTRVSGRLPRAARPALEANVGRAVSSYVDGAFLSGDYPRTDFSDAFASFTPGAARDARADQGLLTNRDLGASTTSVRATRQTAYLSVLAPFRVAAGVTARVDLRFVVRRADAPAERVRVAGRLLLTRDGAGGDWSVFGYDLHRSQAPSAGGAS
jgi:hypothetical protein